MDKFVIRKRSEESIPKLPSSSTQDSNKSGEAKRKKLYSFQGNWETDFLVVTNDENTGVICVLCHAPLSGFRKANCQRHYETHHSAFSDQYPTGSDARIHKIKELKSQLQRQQKSFSFNVNSSVNKLSTEVSVSVSHKLVQHGMPFTSGEIVKECIVSAVTTLAESIPEKYRSVLINAAKNVPLSNDTVARRVDLIAAQIKKKALQKLSECSYFSLAVDESTDIASVAQLACFVRCIDNVGIVEDFFLTILPLPGTTTGQDIYNAVANFLKPNGIDLSKLVCVVTDGAPSMVGKNKGFVALLKNDEHFPPFVHYHCLIHVENLASYLKSVPEISEQLKLIIKLINFLVSKPLNKRLLKVFLHDLSAPHSELILHADVRWLSRGEAITRVWKVFEEIKAFISANDYVTKFPEIFGDDFKINLAFMVDLFQYLTELNKRLQGQKNTICELKEIIFSFRSKLKRFLGTASKNDLVHFPELAHTLSSLGRPHSEGPKIVVLAIQDLLKEFDTRFHVLEESEPLFNMVLNPFQFNVDSLRKIQIIQQHNLARAELELIELQSSEALKYLFEKERITDFWGANDTMKFPTLRNASLKCLAMFGTTYLCEKCFSLMKYIKNKARSRLNDSHLEDCLRVAASDFSLDISEILSNIQAQGSH
jgi:zinc finger BED domain-containing protein 5/7/8/9